MSHPTATQTIAAKPIPSHQRLIVALDLPEPDPALRLVDRLGEHVSFYKIGLEMFMSGGYFELLKELDRRQKKVFVDLKFFDIPNTVASAVRRLNDWPVELCTVHGNDGMLRAAADAADGVKVLAVTALTSLDQGDLDDLGFQCDVRALVLSRAKRALDAGCAGVVSSGLEAPLLRESLDHRLLVVCPGIRPVANVGDQKRTVDVATAFANGADYIVMGRPIHGAEDPAAAASQVQQAIAGVFGG